MILDMQSLFSYKQAIVATAVSTNVVDLGATQAPVNRASAITPAVVLTKDLGRGEPVPILVQVSQAFNTLTSLTIVLQKSIDAAFTTPVTVDSQSIVLANLTVGQLGNMIWVPYSSNFRFLRFSYTVVGTNPTLGQITAGLCMGVQTNFNG